MKRSNEMIGDPPACPITGEPAVALVQRIHAEFLARLWKIEFRVDARPSFRGEKELSLWRSPTGLLFFSPAFAGDAAFYAGYYRSLRPFFTPEAGFRGEFLDAARYIPHGARVLDVGCGFGAFRLAVPHAEYLGLDPHFAGEGGAGVRAESLAEHLKTASRNYDAVCAFQVIEHVANPAAMFADMAAAARPGGLIILGVPQVPSAMCRIPNFLLNAPPHHLTWWTEKALSVLAARQGLAVEAIEKVRWSEIDSIIYWIERCSFLRCADIYYKPSWVWHLSALTGFVLGYLMARIFGPPKRQTDEGSGLLLIARKPMAPI